MPDAVFNILSLELPRGAETFRMTFEPKYPGPLTIEIKPAVVDVPVVRPQNGPSTIEQKTVLQRVPIGSGSSAIVATYPVPKKIRVIDPLDPSATESESEPSTPQLLLKLLESASKVQDPNDLSTVNPPGDPPPEQSPKRKHQSTPKVSPKKRSKGKQPATSITPERPRNCKQPSPLRASSSTYKYSKPVASGSSRYYGCK
ncbi:hypothetical protein BDN67DRAFT_984862 [Paxillus ammoniavirescens]|nr:hypothetical protein BDN67DRAFT_984862 [Paxillus ammoniavirescens]